VCPLPRFEFLNWRPDLEDTEYEGLTVADNVVHDVEGWKEVKFVTDGAVSTITSAGNILFTTGQTIGAMQIRQLGNIFDTSDSNKVAAYLRDAVGPQFVVDFFNTTTPQSTSGSLMTSGYAITGFQVAELNKTIVVCAQATGTAASGTAVALNITGHTSIT
jgi:hypothetical protein